jgi:hypothetical protein
METKGYLDFSQVDASQGRTDWQTFDDIWSTRAHQGIGVKGGPNNGATMYFYQVPFWYPYGKTWGAEFPPTKTCTSNTGSPPPSIAPTDTPVPTATAAPTPTPTAAPTGTPVPTPSPSAAALPLFPLSFLVRVRRRRRN